MCTYRSTLPAVDPSQRVGDDERERASTELRAHFTAGRLDVEEFSARLDEVWAARTAGDIHRAQRDLPPVRNQPGASHRHPHPLLLLAAILTGVWLLTTPGGAFWPIWPLAIWAAIVLLRRRRRRSWAGAVSAWEGPVAAPR